MTDHIEKYDVVLLNKNNEIKNETNEVYFIVASECMIKKDNITAVPAIDFSGFHWKIKHA